MIRNLFLFSIFLVSVNFVSVYGSVQNFSTDQPIYHDGDTIKISGTVDYDPDVPSVILQIITPDGTGLAGIANVVPKPDGSFSTTFHAGGPTWSTAGAYTIKVSYAGNLEKTVVYQKSSDTLPDDVSDAPISKPAKNIDELNADQPYVENPKLRISGFPSLEHSPQYYIDRYANEPNYKSWFDSQFSNHSIVDVVGYKSTHISGFPSLEHSPQYYIDRYNNEPNYKSWFDSQFPEKTMYDILGFSSFVPDWIKTYAQLWAVGNISDSEFVSVLNFMLEHKIIIISDSPYSKDDSIDDIPNWIRNNAKWWSNDLISQQEFIHSLQYLIEEKIIEIQ